MSDNFDDELKIKDLKLIHRAVRNRWQIPVELKDKLIDRMANILNFGEDKEALNAAKILIAAESQNQKDEIQSQKEDNYKERIYLIAKQLGILSEIKKISHCEQGDK